MILATEDPMLQRIFDSGLDEMAAGARATFVARLSATLAVAVIALAFLPWPVCLAWFAYTAGVDAASWPVSRDQFFGRPVSMAVRLRYVATLVAGVAGWVTLGV